MVRNDGENAIMRFFSRRLSLSLSLCNIAAAGINFLSILFYSQFFGLTEIGILATITSITALVMPLMTFRLDLAFQRLIPADRPSLTAAILTWIVAASAFVALLLCGVHLVFEWQGALIVLAIPLHLGLSAASQALWAQNVCDRRLGRVAMLQVARALLASILPFALVAAMDGAKALILGNLLAQLFLFLFLPAPRHFRLDTLRTRFVWVNDEARDLVVSNTLPLLINSASLHLNPVIAAVVFGPEAAAIIWMVIRIFLTPASMIADPIRRDYYASYTDGRKIVFDVWRPILRYKIFVFAAAMPLVAAAAYLATQTDLLGFLGELGRYPRVAVLGLIWACAILLNAPSTGLIPILKMALIQSAVETLGFFARIGSLMLGLAGVTMADCLMVFMILTITINFSFGIVIDLRLRRTLAHMKP